MLTITLTIQNKSKAVSKSLNAFLRMDGYDIFIQLSCNHTVLVFIQACINISYITFQNLTL